MSSANQLDPLDLETAPLELAAGGTQKPRQSYYWLWVMCLLGLDYFSTLAYQPSITFEVAGRLGPLATAVIVLLTLFGALPVYFYLAGRSPRGQGSLAVFEHLVRGWRGKTLVLILLGFAATDFTMLKAISLADASVHVLNQHDAFRKEKIHAFAQWLQQQGTTYLGPQAGEYLNEQLVVTLFLGMLCFLFWFVLRKGFNRNVLILSVPLVGVYLLLNGILLGAGIQRLVDEPEIVAAWLEQLQCGDWQAARGPRWEDGWAGLFFMSLLFLPNLALGLSGFELSLILMPQVRGRLGESERHPAQRIRNTRKVLVSAAIIMSTYLLASVLVTTLLIPPGEFGTGGGASNRALAYLAHGGALSQGGPLLPWCGLALGTLYDGVTVLVLCLAGTSVMTALSVLLPHFLSRFGMEFRQTRKWGVMLGLFAAINVAITLWFKASVEAQRGAYAAAVLVLIAAASVATLYDKKQIHRTQPRPPLLFWAGWLYYAGIALVFALIMLAVALHSARGLGIALCFIFSILAMSVFSRAWRANEMRTIGFDFVDEQSKFLWDSLRLADFPALVPHRPGRCPREAKEKQIRVEHQLTADADIVFLEVEVDDPSNFYQRLLIEVSQAESCFVIKVQRCASAPHAIAAVAMEMSRTSAPPGLHFGWPEMDMLSASWSYLAFGEGNVPWKVRELIQRLEKDPLKRPRVIVG
jgi:hypothetical protein